MNPDTYSLVFDSLVPELLKHFYEVVEKNEAHESAFVTALTVAYLHFLNSCEINKKQKEAIIRSIDAGLNEKKY